MPAREREREIEKKIVYDMIVADARAQHTHREKERVRQAREHNTESVTV